MKSLNKFKNIIFIENDCMIRHEVFEYIEELIGFDIRKNKNFKQILDASENKSLFEEVVKADLIFLYSCYIGSEELLINLCQLALQHKLKDKVILNLFSWKDVAWHIPDESRPLIKQLKIENNIEFLYWEDSKEIESIISKI